MRYGLYTILIIVWSLFCWWRYSCHIKQTCCPPDQITQTEIVDELPADNRPALFSWSSAALTPGESFNSFADSIVGTLQNEDELHITGLYYRDEENKTKYENLGLARAEGMRELLADRLSAERMKAKAKLIPVQGDVRSRMFEGISFSRKINNEFIKEIDDKVLIYFPWNSTKKLDNPMIDQYLADIANRMKASNAVVRLIGHTDNEGPSKANYNLGYWRAGAIKDILVDEKGVDPAKVKLESKGETEPIGDNKTVVGMRQNRRVELILER